MPSLLSRLRAPGRGRRSGVSVLGGLVVVALLILAAVGGFVALSRSGSDPAPPSGAAPTAPVPEGLPIRLSDARQYSGPSYRVPGHAATKDKNQTKLWYAGGSWWGVLLDGRTQTTRIFRWTGTSWHNTGVLVDRRTRSLADAVWTGRQLYIASRISNGSSYLMRYRLRGGRTWVPVTALPRTIATGGSSSLSIAVDSRRRVWAAFNRNGHIWVTQSAAGQPFAPARLMPGPDAVRPDDTAAVVASRGRVAVMWSDQVGGAFRFALRNDGDPVGVMRLQGPAERGIRFADGHIRLLAMSDGRILAAVKTSLGDAVKHPARSPLLVLLVRSRAGTWTQHVVATQGDEMTRPQIVLSSDEKRLFLLATSPQTGGNIFVKVADTRTMTFAPGKGTRVLTSGAGKLNNATTTRGLVSPRTGILFLASDTKHARYYTGEIPIPRPAPAG
jgi:hypothetical protein